MWSLVLGPIVDLATGWVQNRGAVKRAKAEAEAKIMVTAANSVAEWERLNAWASMHSWKDEAWTIAFIAILTACFLPFLQPYVKEGFAFLHEAPEWFQWSVMASIAASFGIRGVNKVGRTFQRNR